MSEPATNGSPTSWTKVAAHFFGMGLAAFLLAWGSGVEWLPAVKAAALAAGTYLAGLMQNKPVVRTPDGRVIAFSQKRP